MEVLKWKPDWPEARRNLEGWWRHTHLAFGVTVMDCPPLENLPDPGPPADLDTQWLGPVYRRQFNEHQMARCRWLGEALPILNCDIGPGSLGAMLGAKMCFSKTTVWYEPCITDPDTHGPIRFDPTGNRALQAHMGLLEEGLAHSNGRYLIGMPDLIENIDTLAAMRGTETLLMDLVERPEWVSAKVDEINLAFFAAFDFINARLRHADGSNVFCPFGIWGPGRTAKLQCDFSCMISPAMFRRFVSPALTRQCDWLDWSMYHLDGTNATQHLNALLEIPALDAIEWTPQAGLPSAGASEWFDLYRRIKAGGKSVQAPWVEAKDVIPLLDAVGPEGMFLQVWVNDLKMAEKLMRDVEPYRS